MCSQEIPETKYMNVTGETVADIELPEQNGLLLFVQCLNEVEPCSFHYKTMAREATETLPALETSTYVAENTDAVLKLSMAPAYYNVEGNVEVTLSFTAAPESRIDVEGVPEDVELEASDLVVKNGAIVGAITKVSAGVFSFTVAPVAKSSFAVILKKQLLTTRGLVLRRGAINMCIFDDEAPYLLNTLYKDGLIEDTEEKTIVVALNEHCSVKSFSGVVVSATQKEGFLNTYEVVVRGTGDATVVFVDDAANEFTFTTSVVYSPESALAVLDMPAANTTLPLNGRVEIVFNHRVSLNSEVHPVELVMENQPALVLPPDVSRYLLVKENRVLIFLDPEMMEEGSVTLTLPEGAFVSEAGKKSEAITMELWVSSKKCNTSYVVQGMRGEKCKCFSVEDRCQCNCGETLFSREY